MVRRMAPSWLAVSGAQRRHLRVIASIVSHRPSLYGDVNRRRYDALLKSTGTETNKHTETDRQRQTETDRRIQTDTDRYKQTCADI